MNRNGYAVTNESGKNAAIHTKIKCCEINNEIYITLLRCEVLYGRINVLGKLHEILGINSTENKICLVSIGHAAIKYKVSSRINSYVSIAVGREYKDSDNVLLTIEFFALRCSNLDLYRVSNASIKLKIGSNPLYNKVSNVRGKVCSNLLKKSSVKNAASVLATNVVNNYGSTRLLNCDSNSLRAACGLIGDNYRSAVRNGNCTEECKLSSNVKFINIKLNVCNGNKLNGVVRKVAAETCRSNNVCLKSLKHSVVVVTLKVTVHKNATVCSIKCIGSGIGCITGNSNDLGVPACEYVICREGCNRSCGKCAKLYLKGLGSTEGLEGDGEFLNSTTDTVMCCIIAVCYGIGGYTTKLTVNLMVVAIIYINGSCANVLKSRDRSGLGCTTRTLHSVVSIFSTGCTYILKLGSVVMATVCLLNLSAKLFITFFTVNNAIVCTGCATSIAYVNVLTNRTSGSVIKLGSIFEVTSNTGLCFGTVSCLARSMAKSLALCVITAGSLTYRCIVTGCIAHIVIKSVNRCIGVAVVTICTGVSGVTTLGTGGICYNRGIVVRTNKSDVCLNNKSVIRNSNMLYCACSGKTEGVSSIVTNSYVIISRIYADFNIITGLRSATDNITGNRICLVVVVLVCKLIVCNTIGYIVDSKLVEDFLLKSIKLLCGSHRGVEDYVCGRIAREGLLAEGNLYLYVRGADIKLVAVKLYTVNNDRNKLVCGVCGIRIRSSGNDDLGSLNTSFKVDGRGTVLGSSVNESYVVDSLLRKLNGNVTVGNVCYGDNGNIVLVKLEGSLLSVAILYGCNPTNVTHCRELKGYAVTVCNGRNVVGCNNAFLAAYVNAYVKSIQGKCPGVGVTTNFRMSVFALKCIITTESITIYGVSVLTLKNYVILCTINSLVRGEAKFLCTRVVKISNSTSVGVTKKSRLNVMLTCYRIRGGHTCIRMSMLVVLTTSHAFGFYRAFPVGACRDRTGGLCGIVALNLDSIAYYVIVRGFLCHRSYSKEVGRDHTDQHHYHYEEC